MLLYFFLVWVIMALCCICDSTDDIKQCSKCTVEYVCSRECESQHSCSNQKPTEEEPHKEAHEEPHKKQPKLVHFTCKIIQRRKYDLKNLDFHNCWMQWN